MSDLHDLAHRGRRAGACRRGHGGLRDAGDRHRGAGLRRRGRVAHFGGFLRRRDPGPRRRARRRGQPGRLRLGRVARPGRHRRHAGRRPRQRPLRHARPRRRPGRTRRRARRGARPVGRRRRVDAHGEEGRAGARSGAGDTGRRPPGPAGLVGRLLGQPGGGGARLDDGHLVVPAAHQRLLSVDAIGGEGADTQTGTGFSVGRAPGDLVPDEAMDEAVARATRMLGAQKAQSAHCTVVFDPRVVSTLLAVVAVGAVGRGGGEGPLLLRRAYRRVRRRRRGDAGRRPDRPPRLRGDLTRRRGAGLPAQRPHLRGRAADVRVRHGVGPPRRDGLHRVGGAGRIRRDTLGRMPRPGARPRRRRGTTRSWPPSGTGSTCSRSPASIRASTP